MTVSSGRRSADDGGPSVHLQRCYDRRAVGKAKLLIAIWTVTALLTLFAVLSLLDGRTRDATEAGIPALLTLGGAVLVTRYRPK